MDYVTYASTLSESVRYLFPDHTRFVHRLSQEGILAHQRGSKEAFDCVLTALASDGTIPNVLPFFPKGTFHDDLPVSASSDLLNVLGAFNKLSVCGVDAQDDYESYLTRNREVGNYAGQKWEDIIPIAPSVKRWIREVFPVPTVLRCKHGPGSTYEKYFQYDKHWAVFKTLDSRPISRFASVPKDVSGNRLIAIEPCSRQFLQQGIAAALRGCPGYRAFFNLHSNTRHVALAASSHYMTVDLKDASDRIPLSLVEYLLPEWYPLFAAHSSAYAEIGSQLHPINSAATMGCGFCFELETLCFALVAALTPEEPFGFRPRGLHEIVKRLSVLSCYGDDLVIPRDWWAAVLPVFLRSGFVPSQKKTCVTPSFKETVGYWIASGKAVRRFLPSLSGTRTELTWDSEVQLLDLIRQSLSCGYSPLAEGLQQKLLKCPIRWNHKFHRLEIKLLCETSDSRPSSLSGAIRYWAYWKCNSPSGGPEFVKKTKNIMWIPFPHDVDPTPYVNRPAKAGKCSSL